mgnify:CR=1 FL=1
MSLASERDRLQAAARQDGAYLISNLVSHAHINAFHQGSQFPTKLFLALLLPS